jgi:Zn-dependent peptidase ImmA (M78 family)/transcriptional regulator with XRE-family HTH domain
MAKAAKAYINGHLIRWARERADMPAEELAKKMGQKPERVADWETGKELPTFKQATKLANVTHVPFGYLFLKNPPADEVPLPDLRTVGTAPARPLDINAKDLIQDVLYKHAWFVEHLTEMGQTALPFAGSFSATAPAADVARSIRDTLKLDDAVRTVNSWEAYLRQLIDLAETAGIWVMRTSIVGNNTHRPLGVGQFRGFAIADKIAPLVFINGRDALAAQIFTFAHELAHIWLGSTGISNVNIGQRDYGTSRATEVACNRIAAEVITPANAFREAWSDAYSLLTNYDRLSHQFKVSQVVAARRALDLGLISDADFSAFYASEIKRWEALKKNDEGSGGSFYNTLPIRNGARFTRAVVNRAMSGETLLRDAGALLNAQPSSIVGYFKNAKAK